MRRRAMPLMASLAALAVMVAAPLRGADAQRAQTPARYSDAWLAQNHTKFDTTLTAAYEAQIGYGTGSPAGRARSAATTLAVPPNVQMSTGTLAGNQNEFQIAINPTDRRYAIGADNDSVFSGSGTGYFRTADGGKTWTGADMPGIGVSCCDPGVAYTDEGVAYFVNLDTSPAVIHVTKSTDNGVTWTKMTDVPSDDRDNIAIDNGATSPYHGRIYVTWSKLSTTPFDIMLNYSDDGGQTWSAPVNVSHKSGSGSIYTQSSNPFVASDGTVYVGFQYYASGTKASAQDLIARSVDGGATFQPATVISAGPNVQGGLELSGDQRGYFAINSGCSTFRHRSFPIIKADPANSQNVYAVWAGGNLELPYQCGTLRGVHSDILFSKSTDGGQTWSAPLKVNDDPEGSDQYYPWMDVLPSGTIWVGWSDRRDDPNNFMSYYYVDRSTNGGASFGLDRRVSSAQSLPSGFIGDYQGLAATTNLTLPMWWDSRANASGDAFTAVIRVR